MRFVAALGKEKYNIKKGEQLRTTTTTTIREIYLKKNKKNKNTEHKNTRHKQTTKQTENKNEHRTANIIQYIYFTIMLVVAVVLFVGERL